LPGGACEHCSRVRIFAVLQVFASAKAREPRRCWLACEPDCAPQGGSTRALHDALERLRIGARPLCGFTPLKPQLALLAANVARVRRGSLVLDPFVGSGSFLAGASFLGAHCFGADIDLAELEGGAAGNGGCGVFANFDSMDLPRPELMGANVLRSPLCGGPRLDAIIADPPYGMRKARHAAHSRGGGHSDYDARAATAEQLHAAVCAMIEPVMHLAAQLLVDGGRLVFLFPTSRALPWWRALGEQHLPCHDELELVCVCEEVFSQMARNLVCMQRRRR